MLGFKLSQDSKRGSYTLLALCCVFLLDNLFNDVITSTMASQINSRTNVYPTVYLGTDQRKHQSSASLAFLRWPVTGNSPHKGPVTRKMFPFDDVIMFYPILHGYYSMAPGSSRFRPTSQIPQCTCPIFYNAPFRTEMSHELTTSW